MEQANEWQKKVQKQMDLHQNEFEKNYKLLSNYLRILLWITVIMFVVAIVSIIRFHQLEEAVKTINNDTKILTEQTAETKAAALEATNSLKTSLGQMRENITNNTQRNEQHLSELKKAVLTLNRIELYLCNGPCG